MIEIVSPIIKKYNISSSNRKDKILVEFYYFFNQVESHLGVPKVVDRSLYHIVDKELLFLDVDCASKIQSNGSNITTRLQGNISRCFTKLFEEGQITENVFQIFKTFTRGEFGTRHWAAFCKKVSSLFDDPEIVWKFHFDYFSSLDSGSPYGDGGSCFKRTSDVNPMCGKLVDMSESMGVITGRSKSKEFGNMRVIFRWRESGKIELFNIYRTSGEKEINIDMLFDILGSSFHTLKSPMSYMNKIIWINNDVYRSEDPISLNIPKFKKGNFITCPHCGQEQDPDSFVVAMDGNSHIFYCGNKHCPGKKIYDNKFRGGVDVEHNEGTFHCFICGDNIDNEYRNNVLMDGVSTVSLLACNYCCENSGNVFYCVSCNQHIFMRDRLQHCHDYPTLMNHPVHNYCGDEPHSYQNTLICTPCNNERIANG